MLMNILNSGIKTQNKMLKSNDITVNESPVRNIIGNGTVIKGEIESNGDIRIDGKLIGSLKSAGKVVIGQNGSVEGDIHCKQIDISGFVKGTVNIEELTSLKSMSRLEVDLFTKQLLIEIGATFTGKCEMGKTENPKVENKK